MSEFINQGSYGCVYSPAFNCEDPDPIPAGNRVTKIFKTDRTEMNPHNFYKNYKTERTLLKAITDLLGQIDPNEDYYVYKFHTCKFKLAENIAKITRTCKNQKTIFKSPPGLTDIWGLNFSKGDRDLKNIIDTLNPADISQYLALLNQLGNVITGIHKLNENGIYHLDIKPGNIIIQNNVLKIIDFGLCKKLTQTNRLQSIFLSIYEYWPIETLWLATPITPNSIFDHMVNYETHLTNTFRTVKVDFTSVNITLPPPPVPLLDTDHQIYNIIDVWSFGIILYEVYNKMPATQEFRNLKKNLEIMIKSLLSGPRKKSPEALQWYTAFLQKINNVGPAASVWMIRN